MVFQIEPQRFYLMYSFSNPTYSFWNPFQSNKYYFTRGFEDFLKEFMHRLVGIDRLGILDYLLILPFILHLIPTYLSMRSFLAFIAYGIITPLKIVIAFFIITFSLPFLFLYNELSLFIGTPTKKLFDDLEVLDVETSAESKSFNNYYSLNNNCSLDFDDFYNAFYESDKTHLSRLNKVHFSSY